MSEVSKYMSTQIFSISPDRFAYEAVDQMYDNKVSAILVKEGEKYIGIITKTDWMFLVLKGECDPKAMKVSIVMTKILNTIDYFVIRNKYLNYHKIKKLLSKQGFVFIN